MENSEVKGKVIRKQSEKPYAEKDGCFVFRDGTILKVHGKTGKLHEVKQSVHKSGYLYFNLNWKKFLSHRFIWEAFFGPIPEGWQINHIDENKQNNNIENLELCDRTYNNNFGTRTERCSKQVNQYDMDGTLVATYPSAMEAARQTGFAQGYISSCCNGKYKSAYKFIWRYVENE